jgi:hypothetical protein
LTSAPDRPAVIGVMVVDGPRSSGGRQRSIIDSD